VYKKGFGIDDSQELIRLVTGRVGGNKRVLIGFNSLQFDSGVLIHLIQNPTISNEELWMFAQTLIAGNRNPYRRHEYFDEIDVLEVLRAGFNTTNLKACAINLKHHRIQDLPIPFDQDVSQEQFDVLIVYNKNDIEITHQVFNYLRPQIEMRVLLSENYKLPLLTESDSGIAKQLFKRTYVEMLKQKHGSENVDVREVLNSRTHRESIHFADVIHPSITFSTPELQEYLEQLKLIVLHKDDEVKAKNFKLQLPTLTIGGLTLKLGLGGIHSEDETGIFKADEQYMLLDADAVSFYPASIINFDVCPEHLDNEVFKQVLVTTLEDRKTYKKKKKESVLFAALEYGLKISLNSIE